MKTNLTHPMTFFILGVPRSGTTILCNLFNALEDGFCLGEPHWYAVNQGVVPLEKMLSIYLSDVRYRAIHNGYNLSGYKETYRLRHKLSDDLVKLHLSFVSFFLIIFRDPVLVHSSQRALGWTEWDTPDDFNESYKRLDELAQHEKGIAIVCEQFVQNPLTYLNQRLPFQIEGDLVLKPTGHEFGDPFANRSTRIVQSQRVICLTDEEIKAHAPGRAIWQKYQTNGKQ